MLRYLNGSEDGVQGGHTRLLHRHGFVGPTSVVHEGCRVNGTVPKDAARINVMYDGSAAPLVA